MAAQKIHHRYLPGGDGRSLTAPYDAFEFDEAEVWSANDAVAGKSEANNKAPKLKYSSHRPIWRKSAMAVDDRPVGPKSLPVNIPDWSKILRDEYQSRSGDLAEDDGDEEEDGYDKMPPHEYLARTRTASFSVHEGIGRTLKGRDMSRVRNAIWKQIGLIDEED